MQPDTSHKIIRIKESYNIKLKEKGSLFHGFAINVTSTDKALQELRKLRKAYFDATHHCYAYKLLSGEEKYSDDGEPNGTAGIRILNSINHFSLVDILVVIVRYFGGTKLGVGPLGKAYTETSMSLLSSAQLIKLTEFEEVKIIYNFDLTNKVHHCINKYNAKNISNSFEEYPVLNCFIEPYKISSFINELTEVSKGRITVKPLNNEIYIEL